MTNSEYTEANVSTRTSTAVVSSQHDCRAAIEGAGDGFLLLDVHGRILECSAAYSQLSGYSKSELLGLSLSALDLYKPWEHCNPDKADYDYRNLYESRHRRKDGSYWDVEISSSFSHQDDGRFFLFVRDISERKNLQQQLHLIAEVFKNTSEAIVITGPDGSILDVNDAYCRITGYERDEVIGENPRKMQSGKHTRKFYEQMWKTLKEEGRWVGEIWDQRKNGEIFPKWLSISAVYNPQDELTHYVGSFSDISVLRGIESELHRMAYFDSLTDLPNRTYFNERLEEELHRCDRYNGTCALLFLDLDRFKLINDTMGHSSGDELLKEVAWRIQEVLRATDIFARMGGDEFTLLLPNTVNADAVAHVAQNILDILHAPIRLRGEEVRVGASIGIAIYPNDGGNVETLIRHADVAMYEAKAKGRGQYRFYSAYMDLVAHEHLSLESDLHRALQNNEFFLHFQPQVDARTDEIVRCEALLRWEHPERGLVSPDKFISVAEDTGLILQIGEWVLREVCRTIQQWRSQAIDVPPIAVNLSAHQFRQQELVHDIIAILDEYAVGINEVEFEITESVAMENAESTLKRLSLLTDKGFSLAIDDFGTGYSSLSYLKTFPVNKLKIDRSFVMDIPQDTNDAAISAAIVRMAHSLGMEVIAEGVETIEQVAFLLEEGCTIMQGYHFSHPLATDDFISLLQSQ